MPVVVVPSEPRVGVELGDKGIGDVGAYGDIVGVVALVVNLIRRPLHRPVLLVEIILHGTCLIGCLIGCLKAYTGCIQGVYGVFRGVLGVYMVYIHVSPKVHRCKYDNTGV